jgi:hypothetical protein
MNGVTMGSRLESSGFAEFDRLHRVFRETRVVLDAVVTRGDLPEGATELVATEALAHVEDVEAGFRAWLRASEGELRELRELVLHGGLGLPVARDPAEERAALAEAMQARTGAGGERDLAPAPSRRLAALAQARLVFAMLPRTPAPDVHWPNGRRSYADIPVPRTPGQLAERIEELERELWWVATGRVPLRPEGAYRRTYGFFDTAERLMGEAFRLS